MKMKSMQLHKYFVAVALTAFLFLQSCQQPGQDKTGSEFMPDMAHSIAYEANYYNYYYNNTWGSQDEYYTLAKPKLPVKGTVPRTVSGGFNVPENGAIPYHYDDTEEERTRATEEIIDNPFEITEKGLAIGKELYTINCAICHGDKGDGAGYLVRDDGGVYPVQPAILTSEEFINASNGRYYHSIMYGKNLMGAYKDKLSYRERWEVIHYVRSLQAKSLSLEYNQYVNTLNEVDRPAGDLPVMTEPDEDMSSHDSEGHENHGDHSHDDDSLHQNENH